MDSLPHDPDRGNGRTTAQLQRAPEKSFFLVESGGYPYTKRLAAHLEREDLSIHPISSYSALTFLRGRRGKVIIDHNLDLTVRQWAELDEYLKRPELTL